MGGFQLSTGFDKLLLQFCDRPKRGGRACRQDQIATFRNARLVTPENFSESAFSAIAQDGVPDGRNRSDDAHPRRISRRITLSCDERRRGRSGSGIRFGRRRSTETQQSESAAVDAPTLFTDGAKIALTPQMLLRAETHRGRGLTRTYEKPGRSDDRQTLAALETTGLDDFAAARGGHASAIADLTGALLAVRTECRLHDF
jgi:hypothetical protein